MFFLVICLKKKGRSNVTYPVRVRVKDGSVSKIFFSDFLRIMLYIVKWILVQASAGTKLGRMVLWHNGTLHNGTLQNGTFHYGTLQNGTLQNGTLQNECHYKTVHITERYVTEWYGYKTVTVTIRYTLQNVTLWNGMCCKTVRHKG